MVGALRRVLTADCKPKYFDVVVVAVRIECWAKQGESGVKLLRCEATVRTQCKCPAIVPAEATLEHGHGGSRVWDTPGTVLPCPPTVGSVHTPHTGTGGHMEA